MPNLYDVANAAKLAGTVTKTYLYPSDLTPRIRNGIIRALETGVIVGDGNTGNLARKVAKCFGLKLHRTHRNHMILPHRDDMTQEHWDMIRNGVVVDYAEYALAQNGRLRSYQQEVHENTLWAIDTRNASNLYVHFFLSKSAATLAKKLPKIRTENDPDKVAQAIAFMQGSEPLVIEQFHA